MSSQDAGDPIIELEIRIAYQDRKIDELDALVRTLVARLDTAERDLVELRRALEPEHVNEPPPHY
jgi:uncharacterized coiled-coil protein SlyX